MNTIETENIMVAVLNGCQELRDELSGGIYAGKRPDNSNVEDIVISSLSLNHEMPQSGTSNVDIYVPDISVSVDGVDQYVVNRDRLRSLTDLVAAAIDAAVIDGVSFWITDETVVSGDAETSSQSHCSLTVEWNIQRNE